MVITMGTIEVLFDKASMSGKRLARVWCCGTISLIGARRICARLNSNKDSVTDEA